MRGSSERMPEQYDFEFPTGGKISMGEQVTPDGPQLYLAMTAAGASEPSLVLQLILSASNRFFPLAAGLQFAYCSSGQPIEGLRMSDQAVSSLVAKPQSPARLKPGPFVWRVTVPGKAPFLVRGLTRHEVACTLDGKLLRGAQITRSRLAEALIDPRSSASSFSIRFGSASGAGSAPRSSVNCCAGPAADRTDQKFCDLRRVRSAATGEVGDAPARS